MDEVQAQPDASRDPRDPVRIRRSFGNGLLPQVVEERTHDWRQEQAKHPDHPWVVDRNDPVKGGRTGIVARLGIGHSASQPSTSAAPNSEPGGETPQTPVLRDAV